MSKQAELQHLKNLVARLESELDQKPVNDVIEQHAARIADLERIIEGQKRACEFALEAKSRTAAQIVKDIYIKEIENLRAEIDGQRAANDILTNRVAELESLISDIKQWDITQYLANIPASPQYLNIPLDIRQRMQRALQASE